ncbi:MAG: Serine/threonine-protein kinase [Cyanobacteriota bacterium]|jgi:serine/threonine protein kinase
MAWVRGDQLQNGRYTIERELKTGRFGVNYIAKNRQDDLLLLKTLDVNSLTSLSESDKERLETMFMKEAVKLTLCQHEHIVKFYEPFKEAGYSCLVMEYIPGETLDKLGKISPEQALIYIQQIGEALTIVHQHNLIHGDVQPENIILRAGKSEAVLIDFDLVLDFDHELTTRRAKELEAKNRPESIELWLKLLNSNSYNANAEGQNANAEGQNVNAEGQNTNAASHINNGTENKPSVNWDKRMQILTLVITAIAAFGGLLQGIASWNGQTTPPSNPTSTKK